MKTIDCLLKLALLPAAIGIATHANGLQLTHIDPTLSSEVIFNFDTTPNIPNSSKLQNPPRLVLEFYNTDLKKNISKKQSGSGNIKKINVIQADNRVKVIMELKKPAQYVAEKQGNNIRLKLRSALQTRTIAKSNQDWVNQVINFPGTPQSQINKAYDPLLAVTRQPVITANTDTQPQRAAVEVPKYRPIMATQPKTPKRHRKVAMTTHSHSVVKQPTHSARSVGRVDFRRDEKGNARIIVNLPDNRVKVNTRKSGNTIITTLKGVSAGQSQKNYDVLDFATPVKKINVAGQGTDSLVKVYVRGDFKYNTERDGNQLVIHVNKFEKKVTAEQLAKKKKKYKGDKLTLNFQDIEIRSVLQLLADFTDKNIVVSDTVKGSITLRLKDVPWDQAMDIVLRSKGLGLRENGTVIWVAPEAELIARENRELEQLRKKKTLEPLISEYISVNFAKASDLLNLIKTTSSADNSSLLSKRGSISVDERTNTVLVHDVVDHVEDIRAMIKTLDVPVRQVSIESRIVIANDEFSKEIGTRFGVTGLAGFNGATGLSTVSGSANATSTIVDAAAGNLNTTGSVFPVGIPNLNDRLSVNLPAAGAPRFGFSILSKDYLVDLELSALQAESKGEIISTPRVVTTNQTKALIEQGVEVPFLQASSSGAANVAFKKAVLSLEVTPQITPEDHVIMDLKINQDTIGRVFNGVPSINTRAVQTKILVDNGQTVVLGGVHEETNQNDVDKVPILGDLPVVGKLFQHTRRNNDKRELLIFVTPKLLE